jgi:hypothetical protein
MALADDIRLRLSAQRALLTHTTLGMRAVSVDVVPEQKRAWVRFIFDGEPSLAEAEAASCACTEIITDFVDDWVFDTEVVATPFPEKMAHRRLVVFARCEDEWVINSPSAGGSDRAATM